MATTPSSGDGARTPEDPASLLAPLLERLREVAPPGSQGMVEQLAKSTFRRMPSSRLRALDLDATVKLLLDAFAFINVRREGELALRVIEPAPEAGWSTAGTVVQINTEDGPFLLTTVTEELARLDLSVVNVIHPVLGIRRDSDGRVAMVLPARQAPTRESFIHIELGTSLGVERRERLTHRLHTVLKDARAATRDFPAMRTQIEEVAFQTRASAGARYRSDEVDEVISLLDWLLDDHFVLLGYREYDLIDTDEGRAVAVRQGSGLGILADESSSRWSVPVSLAEVAPDLRSRMEAGELLVVSRTNALSTVHRQARMIYVGVKKVGGDGEIHGECRFLGLFAQKAYAEPASTIPVLRRKLRQILEREDVVDHSFDERALRVLFDAIPKHELFAADTDSLRRTLVDLLEVQKGQEVRLILRVGEDPGSLSVLVAVPRDRFSGTIRKRVQQLLVESLGARSVDYHLTMTERDRALLHFVLHGGGEPLREVSADDLERAVNALTRAWADDLLDELVRLHGQEEGQRLASTFTQLLPAGYAETTTVQTAADDIGELDALCHGADEDCVDVTMRLRRDIAREGLVRFTLYKLGPGVELSSFLPILESLGLTVVEEIPYRVEGTGGGAPAEMHIHDFGVRSADADLDVDRDGDRVAAAAMAIWQRRAEADRLNRLVVAADLTWDDVVVLRTYRRYRRQVGTTFTEAYLDEALVRHPGVARSLVELFAARFDPGRSTDAGGVEAARQRVLEGCDAVERLDHDRILRGYLGMIDATLRTNRWAARGRDERDHLAMKFDSAAVPDMPKPVPYREIFVCSPAMEGVHLRGGPVARGGLRWSDRIEDFRTEVLGLMKAQMVKNAVIVPTGSKGGFVLKRPPTDPAEARTEVQRQYEVFIRGLLDVTDNVVTGSAGQRVEPPPGVRRADGDDPYLVVAADRGTATFSDVANAISEEYGFWLGDAFASGGSRGYDHKAMGITARGAWVAVQRHFRELDIDVQTEPTTVVGIGDMSGDVFGNGLLRSRAVRLVAAFDHRDIFLDPDPDPELSYEERRRLFELPRSSWRDYDPARISKGGGVWSRELKSIPLSEEVRATLRTDSAELSPPELVRAILKAPSDLLFAGGIGTFVKASDESDADVGDRANDAVRIDAAQVGARVVGEGGNLAFTQRGRMQYARRGGRINTDAIDNSAGVDTSDREVNLKILLSQLIADGVMAPDERDGLLVAMTEEVAELVLRDVYLQTWVISQELEGSPGGMEAYETLMHDLETLEDGDTPATARLDRSVEWLPTPSEMERRRTSGAGLTRPELAVLLGYSKVDLTDRLLATTAPDEPLLGEALEDYFPDLVLDRFGDRLHEHSLHRQLVATVVANDLVNRMGITYVSRTAHELGSASADVATAYWVARQVSDADEHWRAIEALDGRIEPTLQLELKAEVDRLVDAFTRSYVRRSGPDLVDAVRLDRPAFHELEKSVAEGAFAGREGAHRRRVLRYVDLGIDTELAERLVGLSDLTLVPDVALVARTTGQSVGNVADIFFRLTEALPLDDLATMLRRIEPEGHWERWQHRGLLDDLRAIRRHAAVGAIAGDGDILPAEAVERFLTRRTGVEERVPAILDRLNREEEPTLPAVAVAVRALRETVEDA